MTNYSIREKENLLNQVYSNRLVMIKKPYPLLAAEMLDYNQQLNYWPFFWGGGGGGGGRGVIDL
jgi:hypothetical protein